MLPWFVSLPPLTSLPFYSTNSFRISVKRLECFFCFVFSCVGWSGLSSSSVSWAITWPKFWLWKPSLNALHTEWHWLMNPIICHSSVEIALALRRRESLPNRQLRVLLMYAIEFHSWWLRHRYKETHSHRLWCAACTCGGYFIDDLCLLINLCLFFTQTHTHIETQIQINHLWVFPLWIYIKYSFIHGFTPV